MIPLRDFLETVWKFERVHIQLKEDVDLYSQFYVGKGYEALCELSDNELSAPVVSYCKFLNGVYCAIELS